jgi:hypothetical protein
MDPRSSLPCSQESTLVFILSQMNPVHTLPLSLGFILISSNWCSDLPSGLFRSRLSTKILYALMYLGEKKNASQEDIGKII